jgi:hypothetical protein
MLQQDEHSRTPGTQPSARTPHLSLDGPAPEGWRSLAAYPLLIIVGLTGVGKSSALQKLVDGPAPIALLPDRRFLTERRIVAPLQGQDNQMQRPVSRLDRFPYVRQFLERHPGGMAEILARIAVEPAHAYALFVFDGLRGPHEITYALAHFPLARFAEFSAPPMLRLERLLARNDPHDQLAETAVWDSGGGEVTFASLGVPDARALFTAAEERTLCAQAAEHPDRAMALQRVLAIMVQEYVLYAPDAAHTILAALEPGRVAFIDTAICTPGEAAAACLALFSGTTMYWSRS